MNIQHDTQEKKFFVEIEGNVSELNYRLEGSVMDIHRTYTPPEMRGQGIAGKITKQALEYAKENELKVIPSCPYVDKYLKKYPDYEHLRA